MTEDARPATAEEQAVLARWSGWGAVPQLFDLDAFATDRAELRDLLNDDEYAAARRSTINTHYTDAALVTAIWTGLRQLGFTGGDVLEPGCGSGHFIGLAPAGARMLGVEREPIGAAIAAALYPSARIVTGSFADLDTADGSFDAVVGNVPFAKVTLHDPRHNGGRHSIHNHFIIKALHLTRPGGTVAVLTSRYTMDATDPAARIEIATLADLVGAIRLPTGAHRRAAGTDVVTDLLILRRREPDTAPRTDFAQTWQHSAPIDRTGSTAVAVNDYFVNHPEHVLGRLAIGRGQHAEDLRVEGDLETLPDRLAAALNTIAEEAARRGLRHAPGDRPTSTITVTTTDPKAAAFLGFLTARADGTFTRRIGTTDQPYAPPATEATELRALLGLRDTAMALIDAEQRSAEDTPHLHDLRSRLNTVYDRYVAGYGPVNRGTERRQLRQAWHVFADWCERHNRTKLLAEPAAVRDFLIDLRHDGLGQDRLRRYLDGIVKAHTTAYHRQIAKATRQLTDAGWSEEDLRDLADDPQKLLALTGLPDLRLPGHTIQAAQEVIAGAPATTNPDLDLDALGLQTTIISRPRQGGFRADPFANVVRALEKFDPTTQTARKADIFTKRVINPPRAKDRADSPEEALSICLDRHSRVDLPQIARLLGLDDPAQARTALGELVYDDPATGEPIWGREYLSGNVRRKLARAQLAAESNLAMATNVAALQQVVPADLGPEDIEIRLGSWIGPRYVQQFLRELLDDPGAIVEHVRGMWHVKGGSRTLAATELWAGGGLDAYQLTERLLVGGDIRVMRTVARADGDGEQEVLDLEATEEARDKARELGDRFADWVWQDTTRAKELIRQYNDTFNAEIPPNFAGVQLSLPGLSSAFRLREHQRTAIARIIYQPATGLVHDVGAGKTLEIIVGVMERRRRGLSTKPAIVVPNDSIAEQFEREWLRAYPAARLLTGTSADLATDQNGRDKRAEFVGRAATGDWDAIILTKESFQRIPLHPEAQERFLQAELDDLRDAKTDNQGSVSQTMTKRLETAIEAAEERLKTRLAEIDRDTAGITLRDSGIDFVVVDEAQTYKNGMIASSLPGLAIDGAARSIDLDMKLAWLRNTHGGSRVVLATATPFTNSFSEIYLWLRRLGHELPPFDTWARTYCASEPFMEMTPGGKLRPKSRMRRVINEPELWQSLRLTSDIKMKAELKLTTPQLRGGQIEIIAVPASVEAQIYTLDLAERERNLKGTPEKGADNHLVIQHDGQLAALDLRILGLHTDQPQKVDVLADDIHTEWHAAKDNRYLRDDGTPHPIPGGLILVFCDESTPGKSWNLYDELKQQLIDRGLPERSIRFIQEATTPQRKADLLAACREGAVCVLIGSTMKMGAGLNVQDRAIGGYEITGPWRPDIPAQARGRIERQGNQNTTFFWKRLVTSPSMDAKKWEVTAQKHAMFAPLYTNTVPSRTREVHDDQAIGLADVMAAATGDPRYREKAELDQEHKALTRQRSAHLRTQQSLRVTITTITERITEQRRLAARQDHIAARRIDTRGDAFRMTIGNHTYDNRAKAADALKDVLLAALAAAPRTPHGLTVPIGHVGGYDLSTTVYPLREQSIVLHLVEAEDRVGLPLEGRALPDRHGIITRLENHVDFVVKAADRTRQTIDEHHRDLEQARAGIGKQFPHEARLAQITTRRRELIHELSDPELGPDPSLDPESPEAKAQAERAHAKAAELQALRQSAYDVSVALSGNPVQPFANWYASIAGQVIAEQRPPADAAYPVWKTLQLGKAARPSASAATRHGPEHPPTARPGAAGDDPPLRPERADAAQPLAEQQRQHGQPGLAAAPTGDQVASDPPKADTALSPTEPPPPAESRLDVPTAATVRPDRAIPEALNTTNRLDPEPALHPAQLADGQYPGGHLQLPRRDSTQPASPLNPSDEPLLAVPDAAFAEPMGERGGDHAAAKPTGEPDGDSAAPVLVIEHNHSGTLVRGTRVDDRDLHTLLRNNRFKYSSRLDAWYLGRQQRHSTRSFRVRQLRGDLERAGRTFEVRTEETTADTAPAPVPSADPFTSRRELDLAVRTVWRAFHLVRQTPAGAQMLHHGGRPDGVALAAAERQVMRAELGTTEPAEIVARYTQLFRTATVLRDNLTTERKRAPVLMRHLADLVELSGVLAGRLAATADHGEPSIFLPTRPRPNAPAPPATTTPAQPSIFDSTPDTEAPTPAEPSARAATGVTVGPDEESHDTPLPPNEAATSNAPVGDLDTSAGAAPIEASASVAHPAASNQDVPASDDDRAPDQPEPAAPPIQAANGAELLAAVLADRAAEQPMRDLASVVITGRGRSGITIYDAHRRLAAEDVDIYRRALAANAGRPKPGQPFDFGRAQRALQRLANGDPTLPLNCVGQYVELTELDPAPNRIPLHSAPTRTVRGIVLDVQHEPTGVVTLRIERDVTCVTGARFATQHFAIDAAVPVLDRATRPTQAELDAARAAMQPAIETRAARLALDTPATGVARQEPASPEPTAGPRTDEAPSSGDHDAEVSNNDPLPLTDADIAVALHHLHATGFVELLSDAETKRIGSAIGEGGWASSRRAGEPDAGAGEQVNYSARGLDIEVHTEQESRAGRITWAQVRRWLRPGITDAARDIARQADHAHLGFHINEDGFLANGEHDLAMRAKRELATYRTNAITMIIDTAHAQHDQTARTAPSQLDSLERHRILNRIASLAAVLPPRGVSRRTPISGLKVADVIVNPADSARPMMLTWPPVEHDGHIELVGDRLSTTRPEPITWRLNSHAGSPTVELVPRPRSLAALMREDHDRSEPEPVVVATPEPEQRQTVSDEAAPAQTVDQPALWEPDVTPDPEGPMPSTAPRRDPLPETPPQPAARPDHTPTPPSVDVAIAQHWSNLVAHAAEHGYAVHTGNEPDSMVVDAERRALFITAQLPALDRLVELAQAVGAIAIQHSQVEVTSTTTPTAAPSGPAPPSASAAPDASTDLANVRALSATPIYDAMQQTPTTSHEPDQISPVLRPAPTESIYDALLREMNIPDPLPPPPEPPAEASRNAPPASSPHHEVPAHGPAPLPDRLAAARRCARTHTQPDLVRARTH